MQVAFTPNPKNPGKIVTRGQVWQLLLSYCFFLVACDSGPSCSKLGLDNPRLVRNLNQIWKIKKWIQFNSFCQQVDDWMLLKITEKIIRENAFEQKKKKPGLNLTLG